MNGFGLMHAKPYSLLKDVMQSRRAVLGPWLHSAKSQLLRCAHDIVVFFVVLAVGYT